jgi:flavin reductase (DIM6/NTAB) family NADH-FMN oxidoreductase RutF
MTDVADLFRRVTTGVYVIGVAEGERRNAFTAAWLTQVSFDPLLLALSVNPEHASYPLLLGGGGFVVNVLRRDQLRLAEAFGTRSGRDQDKLAGIPWHPAPSGAPILTGALAWIDCRLHDRFRAGDHEIILARPVAGELVAPEAAPLLYHDTGEIDGSRELYSDSLG